MERYQRLPQKAVLTPDQEQAMVEARVTFMTHCPFFAYYFYDQLTEYPTFEIPMAATDGKRIFYNPEYLRKLRPAERCFVFAHETYHCIWLHAVRMRYYRREGKIEGLPYNPLLFNFAADYVINADLVANNIGLCNPEWLLDPKIKGTDKIEEVYVKLYKDLPEPVKFGRGSQPDKTAQQHGNRFDDHREPHVDPVTARPDEISEVAHAQAVAAAYDAAKAIGKMPGFIERLVTEILNPQVEWRDEVRMLITGKVGHRREDWMRPNRRRLVLNPIIIMPGRRGYGAELIAVWIDNSGSIGKAEYNTFFSEIGSIITDVRPKRLFVGWCDADVQRTEWATSLEEWHDHNYKPTKGGGGTDFRPPFRYMADNDIVPDTCIYLTDLYGPTPRFAPRFPVIWCCTTEQRASWGNTIRIHA